MANLLMTAVETGVVTFFLGMGVVFFGIAVLVLSIFVIGKILKAARKKKEEPAPTALAPDIPSATAEEEVPERLVAIITAAVYAYYEARNEKCEFTVKKIIRRS